MTEIPPRVSGSDIDNAVETALLAVFRDRTLWASDDLDEIRMGTLRAIIRVAVATTLDRERNR